MTIKQLTVPDWTQADLDTVIDGGAPPLPPAGTLISGVCLPSDWNGLQAEFDAKANASSLASYVPYTGATANVDLGTFDLITDTITSKSSSGLILEANGGGDVLHIGSGGGVNATAYGGWNFDGATADTIASFGASKTLTSLNTATYPSLTEISYVKGVTSPIQTQLNGKQATLVSGTNIKTINGSTLLGSGDLTVATSPSGSNTEIQYNNSGAFGSSAKFIYDGTDVKIESSTSGRGLFIGTATGGFGYYLGRNTSTGFLDILGTQGSPFDGVQVTTLRASSSITINGENVIRNWSSSLGLGSGSGTAGAVLEIRGNTQDILIGGGTGFSYLIGRNTGTGIFEFTGQQSGYTGYRFNTASVNDALVIQDDADVGVGVATANIAAKLHIIKTTEQQRIGYDTSNYYSTTVSSAGAVTFDATGSAPEFKFNDKVTAVAKDIEVTGSANGLILESPNGTRWRITVGDTGALTATSL